MEHVNLDHALQVAIGAGGAEHLVLRIRPARPVSSWWGTSTSITPCRWPSRGLGSNGTKNQRKPYQRFSVSS
ncbi:hypothetical protein ACLBWF_36080, partial [Pseudomonas aeruginosa]|uniref:hypothetical protein n=1 Tax=Pseudomonas aeruginosa TaxID=287 RepID=UPI00396868F0